MPILKIEQNAVGDDEYNVNASLTIDGQAPASANANAKFRFALTPQDKEDIRWYLEDYLQYPMDPAPKIAARIEERMNDIGGELFKNLFPDGSDNYDLWVEVRNRMSDVRVEISTGVAEAASIPWELLREPKADAFLAISTKEFTRVNSGNAQKPKMPRIDGGAIRILFVICRPAKGDDVPFRSVAGRIIKTLDMDDSNIQFHVLRPPTYARLSEVLQAAKGAGKPYHVVHFDGHGTYGKFGDDESHGYLLFENPDSDNNILLVDGESLGQLLYENDVPALTLNACRSAHADTPEKPRSGDDDVHNQTRSFGSLALEVVDAGVAGVVAMRYNVYVVTAAQFVADLYTGLISGQSLGEAVSHGRKQLKAQPNREIAFEPRPLQDWVVPIVYEAAPIKLFKKRERVELTINPKIATGTGQEPDQLRAPDVGFFGRDETILALDRAFDTQHVVLLHAYAGSGKTTTAGEFARWYAKTDGLQGPVLFNTFEHLTTLRNVLANFGSVFGQSLEQSGINWTALDEKSQREIALQVMRQIPVLWIWDNVEPVSGFPKGTDSQWSKPERNDLLNFLRDASRTEAKFLLTSRRDEMDWLGLLPARVTLPPMPLQEMVELARAIADKHRTRISTVKSWKPLFKFAAGNPLTVTTLVGQVLRMGLSTEGEIRDFVDKLRAGEADFDDDEEQGRSKSLGASLKYGFEHAFNEAELKQLALLSFFQGFVDVDVLRMMGDPDASWCLPEVRGLSREYGIALLDRAAEVGLLTAHGGGYYSIHPAMPWFIRNIYERYYATQEQRQAATRAFVEAMGELGNYYQRQFNKGNRDVIHALGAEEANLLHARRLARSNRWLGAVTSAMQGLHMLYYHTGRHGEWAGLVEEIVPDFTDMKTDHPLPGLEETWNIVTEYRTHITRRSQRFKEAERLQLIRVEVNKKLAAPYLVIPPQDLDNKQRNTIRSLATSIHDLGETQRELRAPECVKAYEETIELAKQIGDKQLEATASYNLGTAYTLPSIRNLDEAERWYNQALELYPATDYLQKARCYGQLGHVAYERFNDARSRENPDVNEMGKHLETAASLYHQALGLTPPNAINDLAISHTQLGNIYGDAGAIDEAKKHYDKSIRYKETASNFYGTGRTRYNVALMYYNTNRFGYALDYAHAALRDYEKYGEHAADMIAKTKELIAYIRAAM